MLEIAGPEGVRTTIEPGPRGPVVHAARELVGPADPEALDPEALNGTNRMKIFVFGSAAGDQVRLVALLDNLGKGASGAAVQNLNLMLGLEEGAGL